MLCLIVVSVFGCSAGNGAGLDQNGRPPGENPQDNFPATTGSYKQIQDQIFTPSCVVCHAGAAAPVGLSLDSANSFANLVSVASIEDPALLRIAPGNAESSYLLQKINGTASIGARMPIGGPPLSNNLIALVREWIDSGALPDAPSSESPAPPRVVATIPFNNSTVTATTTTVVLVFSVPMDFSLLTSDTIILTGAGDDALFDTTDDQALIPASVLSSNPQTVVLTFPDMPLPDGIYRVKMSDEVTPVLTSLDGIGFDGNNDRQAGGDFVLFFTVQNGPAQVQATWRWIQDNVFTPVCTQCHISGGVASFLPLDQNNSYANLVNRPSSEIGDLLLVAPGDADNSYLVQKVEGTAAVGARMPLNLEPLAPEVNTAIRDWINAGALLTDGDPLPDTTPPIISVAAPAGMLRETVVITAAVLDLNVIRFARLLVDDIEIARVTSAPYSFSLDTTLLTDGDHLLQIEAEDIAGNVGASTPTTITVDNAPPADNTAPVVALDSFNAPLSGLITLSVTASDDINVISVSLLLDGAAVQTSNESPYQFFLDTLTIDDGHHTLQASATDAAGNIGLSTQQSVIIDNIPPADTVSPQVIINNPPDPASGTVTVSVMATDNIGVTLVRLYLNGVLIQSASTAPYDFQLDTVSLGNAPHALRAEADDGAGNTGLSNIVTLNVDNSLPPDTEPPTALLSLPANPVSGSVTITVQASDNVGISDVSLFIDGANFGSKNVPPFDFTVDTTQLNNGNHVVLAQALDSAGNEGQSTSQTLVVDNGPPPDLTAPVVSIQTPQVALTGTVSITLDASDDTGVLSVTLLIDGVAASEAQNAPYVIALDVTTFLDGIHLLSATAVDEAGNLGAANPVAVTVANGGPQATLPWIQATIFDPSCIVCHVNGGFASFLQLTDPESFAELINVASTNGGGGLRVEPGNPQDSSLLQRLDGTLQPSMPLGGDLLDAPLIDAVQRWIADGAFAEPPDVIAPAVTLQPAQSPAIGTITLSAVAIDDIAVSTVRFLIDNIEIGSDTTSPFETPLDTTLFSDGVHQVNARAEDAAGNVGVSVTQFLAVENNQ